MSVSLSISIMHLREVVGFWEVSLIFTLTAHREGDLQLFFSPNNTAICILSPHMLLYNVLVCKYFCHISFYSEY